MAIKKSFQALALALEAFPEAYKVALPLMEAKKGGFSGEDMFVTVDGVKVARECAMTHAIFAHDNTDKTVSYFYKNGSYMIGAEVVKANARKAWDITKEEAEATLEAQMLDGEITPQEWKEATTALASNEFTFELDDTTKQELIESFNGYASKEDFITAYEADEVAPFTDYEEEIKALRALAPKREEEA